MNDEEIFAKLALFKRELDGIRRNWDLAAIGQANVKDVVYIQRKMNAELSERIRLQERELAYIMGEKIEPEMHFGEAILLPAGGMNS